MGWQKRVETAQDRRKQQKNKKLRKDQRSLHKALVQNELWPLLQKFKDIGPDLPLGKMHVWVDTMPGPSQKQQSAIDEVDDFDSTMSSRNNNNKKKKGKSKGEPIPATKKHHPRSHENADDDGAEGDERLLCHEFFFTGKCQGLNKGGGGKSKKCVPQCHFVHPLKKELTLAAALQAKIAKGSKSAKQMDTDLKDVLKCSSSSALATQMKLDGDEMLEEDSPLSESVGIDMLYHMEVPLLVEGAAKNITGLVTNLLAREKVAVSSIAYVVYDNVLLFDRCDGGKVISSEIEAAIFGNKDDDEKEDVRSDTFITFPATVLEHILMYLPGSYSGLLPMVCKSFHSEIGAHSPSLWRQLILREGWTEPKNVQIDPMTLYKSFFISHERICQRVEALKVGVTKLIEPDSEIELSRGTALGPMNEDQDDMSSTAMHLWDEYSVIIASQNDCMVHLHQVSKQRSTDEKCLREIMQVRLAPVPISKKKDCTLSKMAIDDRYVLFSFDVHDNSNDGSFIDRKSILTSIMKDELLSNSTEDTIECGDYLKRHDLFLMVKDLIDRKQDHIELRFLSDLLMEGQSSDLPSENDLRFDVLDLEQIGHGIFCVLVRLWHLNVEIDEEGIPFDDPGIVLLSFSASNGREAVLDCVSIPGHINVGSAMLSSNIQWKQRSDPVEIVCKCSHSHEMFVINVDRSGVFHQNPDSHRYRTAEPAFVPRVPTAEMPKYSSHTLRTPSRLVGYSRDGGSLDVYDVYDTKDDTSPQNLPLQEDFNIVLSMTHLDNDYVMMICRRDSDSLPAEEDIDGHWFGDNYVPQPNLYCLYFIVIHIPSMEEIYVSKIISSEKEDVMVAIGKGGTIAAAVGGRGSCFSSPFVVTLKALEEQLICEIVSKQKKVKKKKRFVAKKGKKDGFARGMSLSG